MIMFKFSWEAGLLLQLCARIRGLNAELGMILLSDSMTGFIYISRCAASEDCYVCIYKNGKFMYRCKYVLERNKLSIPEQGTQPIVDDECSASNRTLCRNKCVSLTSKTLNTTRCYVGHQHHD